MKDKQRKVTLLSPKEKGHQLVSMKVRPNDPCKCKSGKKYKNCCGVETSYYSIKPSNSHTD